VNEFIYEIVERPKTEEHISPPAIYCTNARDAEQRALEIKLRDGYFPEIFIYRREAVMQYDLSFARKEIR
tara:strand:- start:1984 stop:2193 length:210 start_codon:yes stop_codon:yes gene_type:complete